MKKPRDALRRVYSSPDGESIFGSWVCDEHARIFQNAIFCSARPAKPARFLCEVCEGQAPYFCHVQEGPNAVPRNFQPHWARS